MYAVIKTGGKQYRVKAGDLLVVEKLDGDPGASVAFGEVLMLGDGGDVTVGAPTVDGAVVNATLIETRKGEKIKVFKKIRRQGYRRTKGHRQTQSVLRVTSVGLKGKEDKWDGQIDLTPKLVLDARARGLKIAEPVEAKAKPAPKKAAAPKTEAKKAEAPAAPAPEAPAPEAKAETNAPAKKAAAPKKAETAKAEAPKAETKKAEAPKAEAKAPAKKAAPKAAKAEGEAKAPAKKAAPQKAAPKKAAAKKDDGEA